VFFFHVVRIIIECISQYILHGNMSVFGGMALRWKLPGRPSSLETPHPHQVKQFRMPLTRDLKGFTGPFLTLAPQRAGNPPPISGKLEKEPRRGIPLQGW
jgi:hypothetical protein